MSKKHMEPNGGRNTFVYDVLEGLKKQISSILAPLEDFDKRYLNPSLERSPLFYCLTIRILEGRYEPGQRSHDWA